MTEVLENTSSITLFSPAHRHFKNTIPALEKLLWAAMALGIPFLQCKPVLVRRRSEGIAAESYPSPGDAFGAHFYERIDEPGNESILMGR